MMLMAVKELHIRDVGVTYACKLHVQNHDKIMCVYTAAISIRGDIHVVLVTLRCVERHDILRDIYIEGLVLWQGS